VASGQTATSYAPGTLSYSTTYYWKIVAGDPDSETTSSAVWSFTTIAQPTETVSAPDTPSGPASGETAQSLNYSTGNSTSNLGHSIEYRFDWGNGNYSTWSAVTDASYAWATPGTYDVKAQARCATHTGVESAWSASHSVVVSAAQEIVTTPGAVSGPMTGDTNDNLTYNVTATSTSSLGHPVEYRFDWGDGSYSNCVSLMVHRGLVRYKGTGTLPNPYHRGVGVDSGVDGRHYRSRRDRVATNYHLPPGKRRCGRG
jgi:hypothetical protein